MKVIPIKNEESYPWLLKKNYSKKYNSGGNVQTQGLLQL